MAIIVCGADKSAKNISQYLKCYITQKIGGDEITVVALMSEQCEVSIRNMWESPFAGDGIGNSGTLDRLSGLTQVYTEKTMKTQLNSQMVWEGAEPPQVQIELKFLAYEDAKHEVDLPINYLMQFSSASLNSGLPISTDASLGRVPSAATFNIGRKMIAPLLISDVAYNLNAPKTKDGFFAYNTVTLTVSMARMVNRSEIPTVFPVG